MKKIFKSFILFLFVLVFVSITACNTKKENEKLKVVTTIYPEYDWVMNVIGDNKDKFEVSVLLNNGTDLHSFNPSVEDIYNISTCDLFIYVGGESDEWVDDVFENSINKNMITLNLVDILGDNAKIEELVEGMQGEEEGSEDEEEETEYDEHVWLSLKNAIIYVNKIKDSLITLDKDNEESYKTNALNYINKLSSLDNLYKEYIDSCTCKTLLFGDRFPFRYLVDDYNVTYFAAFVGCSTETNASFETITYLSNKVNELGLSCILKIDGSNGEISETIKQNTNSKDQVILTLDSLQTLSKKDYESGKTYLKVMTDNLSIIKQALK